MLPSIQFLWPEHTDFTLVLSTSFGLTHPLTHFFSYSLIYLLSTYLLTYSLTHPFLLTYLLRFLPTSYSLTLTYLHIYLLTHSLTYSLTYLLTYSLTHSPTNWTDWLTDCLTHLIEQNPSVRANQFSASHPIPNILLHPQVPFTCFILSHIGVVHALTSHFLRICLNFLPSIPGPSKWSLSSGFPTKTVYTPLFSPMHATCCPPHSSHYDHQNNIFWRVQIIKLIIM